MAAVRSMFDAIAPRYDLVNRVMTGGLDVRWRKACVRALALPPGALVLDLACGTGELGALARGAGYRVLGFDLSWGMLCQHPERIPTAQGDVTHLPLPAHAVDGVVCGYGLRNFADLAAAFAEMARVVRPGGRVSLLEVGDPPPGALRTGYRLWFEHVVPALGGLLSDGGAYRYLPRSTAYLPPGHELRRMLEDAGFRAVGRRLLYGGLSQLLTATRGGMPPDGETGSGVGARSGPDSHDGQVR